jgi:DNA-binding response OmpR family regulator
MPKKDEMMTGNFLLITGSDPLASMLESVLKDKVNPSLVFDRCRTASDAAEFCKEKTPLIFVIDNRLDDIEGMGFELAKELYKLKRLQKVPLVILCDDHKQEAEIESSGFYFAFKTVFFNPIFNALMSIEG